MYIYVLFAFWVASSTGSYPRDATLDRLDAISRIFINGVGLLDRGDFEKAKKYFEYTVEVIPDIPESFTNLGLSLERYGQNDNAIRVFKKGVKRFPSVSQTHNYLCNNLLKLYEMGGNHEARDSAYYHCGHAIELNTSDPVAQFGQATFYTHLQLYNFAIKHFYIGIGLQTETSATIFQNLANAFLRAGVYDMARQICDDLIKSSPTPEVHRLVSTVYVTTEAFSEKAMHSALLGTKLSMEKRKLAKCKKLEVLDDWLQAIPYHSTPSAYNDRTPAIIFGGSRSAESVVFGADGGRVTMGIGRRKNLPPLGFKEKTAFVVVMDDVTIQGQSGIVSKGCTVYVGDHLHEAKLHEEFETEPAVYQENYDVAVGHVVINKAGNYYHWACEGLSRIFLLLRTVRSKMQKILLPKHKHVEQSLELLIKLGLVTKSQLVWLTPTPYHRYHIKRIYVAQWIQQDKQDNNNKDSWYVYRPPQWVIQDVRATLTKAVCGGNDPLPQCTNTPPIVYISRGDAGCRKVKDEGVLLELMRALVGKENILVFTGTKSTFAEQVATFANARVVVGPHGAGFANLMFVPAGGSVIAFPMNPPVDNAWEYLSNALDLRFFVVPELYSFYYTNYNLTTAGVLRTLITLADICVANGLLERNDDRIRRLMSKIEREGWDPTVVDWDVVEGAGNKIEDARTIQGIQQRTMPMGKRLGITEKSRSQEKEAPKKNKKPRSQEEESPKNNKKPTLSKKATLASALPTELGDSLITNAQKKPKDWKDELVDEIINDL